MNRKKLIIQARKSARRVESTGNILDIISRSIDKDEHEKQFAFGDKKDWWTNDTPLSINDTIRQIVDDFKNIELEISDNMQSLEIINFIKHPEEGKIRPKNFFYEEILYEIIYNVSKYSYSADSIKKVLLDYDSEQGLYYLQNDITSEDYDNLLSKYGYSRRTWKIVKQSTGLYYYHNVLMITHTGCLKVRLHTDEQGWYFKIALDFKGMKINNNGQNKSFIN